jgi:hypothetical protein
MKPELPQPLAEQVRSLVRAGDKIQAIKLLRDQRPDFGLAEAKDYVERLGADPDPKSTPPSSRADPAGSPVPGPVREALLRGNKIEAIKHYQKFHAGCSLAEAKQAVDQIEASLGHMGPQRLEVREGKTGCLGLLLLVLLLLSVAAFVG